MPAKLVREQAKAASSKIAIVGIGCRYSDSTDPKSFWLNVLAKRQQFRKNQRSDRAGHAHLKMPLN
jgi:acyl transferase domain-containing protein